MQQWVRAGWAQLNILYSRSIKCMATKLDKCVLSQTFLSEALCWGILNKGKEKKRKNKTTLKSPVTEWHNGPHQAQTALAYSPFNPFYWIPFRQGSLHLGILHKLVCICRWAVNAYTYRQEKFSNLIHSGSSYNIRAAQQVVLWCLSLVLKCCDFWVLWKKRKT